MQKMSDCLSVHLDPDEKIKVVALANRDGLSASEYLRGLVKRELHDQRRLYQDLHQIFATASERRER